MDERKAKKLTGYIQDRDIAVFDELTDISEHLEMIAESLNGVRLSDIDQLKGEDGEDGEDGEQGERGSMFLGVFETEEELPEDAKEGDWAIIDGEIWRLMD